MSEEMKVMEKTEDICIKKYICFPRGLPSGLVCCDYSLSDLAAEVFWEERKIMQSFEG